MAVEEHRRIRLFERLQSLLGQEEAVTMLELLPPAGQDVLTREDLRRELTDVVRQDDIRDVVRKDDLREELSHYATKADIYRIFTLQIVALSALFGAATAVFS